ncbi:MAG: transposase [Acidobacteriia bacterium]|nr:transposase [Terriglobia bacterium]
MLYTLRSGCAWRMLSNDLPPSQTVYKYFRAWTADGTWKLVNETLRSVVRDAEGRDAAPSVAITDSQSVKTTERRSPEDPPNVDALRAWLVGAEDRELPTDRLLDR